MQLVYFTIFATLAFAACPGIPQVAVWEVRRGEVFDDVLDALGLEGYTEIEQINRDLKLFDVNRIRPGDRYGIPYVRDIELPATWITSSCVPTLYLDGETGTSHTPSATPTRTGAIRSSQVLGTTPSSTPPSETFNPSSTILSPTSKRETTNTPFSTPTNTRTPSTITTPATSSTSTTPAAVTSTTSPTELAPEDVRRFCRGGNGDYLTDDYLQSLTAENFCQRHKSEVLNEGHDSISDIYKGPRDEIYQYTLYWIKGCTLLEQQNLDHCEDIMRGNYKECNNGGKGGIAWYRCIGLEYRSNWFRDVEA